MTAAERQAIRNEINRRQQARHKPPDRPSVNAETYMRILTACCPDSPINVEAHAHRIATRVTQARGAQEKAA
ncbi:MAG: hypothetical protein NUW01_02785 [Gemmatimonadaceae bacterium]|nr:hypothetical protein [Gemmatimonadaceae bacterium]